MSTIPFKTLGSDGPQVSAVGLGCLSLTGHHGHWAGEDVALATVRRALELGITLFDTADAYGPYKNEEFVGRALGDHVDDVVIVTKFGIVKTTGPMEERMRGDTAYVRSACEASLRRLGIDVIDMYLVHRADPKVPIEETVGALHELVEEGKVRYLGLSEPSADTIRRAHAVHPMSVVQSEWSLWSRDIEEDILPVTRELGIGMMPFRPLGTGFLTGQISSIDDLPPDDGRRHMPRFQGENFQRNLDLVEHVHVLAAERGCTPAQLALAWLYAQGDDVVPIPGADRPEYVEDNVAALDIHLTGDELASIDAVFPAGVAAGERYGDMTWVRHQTPTRQP